MARSRALATFAAALAVAGVCTLPAAARPPAGDHQLTSTHFMVHYNTDIDPTTGEPGKDYATQTDAGNIASYAEQAYATYVSWGYAPPPSDGDGLIDIYIEDLSGPPPYESIVTPDFAGPGGSTASFMLASTAQMKGFADTHGLSLAQEEQVVVAEDVFAMFEWANWVQTTGGDDWLLWGPSAWAALASMPSAPTLSIGDPDIALNCSETLGSDHRMCDPDLAINSGLARYTFFGLLASRYGNSFLNGVFANGAAGETSTAALSNALATEGTTLAATYDDYANRFMSGTLGPPQLAAVRPPVFANVTAGVDPVATTTTAAVVPVNHLAARYVTFQRGDGDGSHPCFAAKLTVNVMMPSGTLSQPDFFWDVPGGAAQPLTVDGNTASITVPWDTCDWGGARGWVSIPNASTTVDGATFTVTYSMSVDTTTPASPGTAPAQTSIWGTTVPVPTDDAAPDIQVYGPELLRVSAGDPSIRLIVESDGPGTLSASLGAASLGQGTLRAGNNDLRFVVPKSLLDSLRRSAAAANLLTLTPASPTGAVTGQAVTRQVVISVVKKKAAVKKKPKPAAKKHTK